MMMRVGALRLVSPLFQEAVNIHSDSETNIIIDAQDWRESYNAKPKTQDAMEMKPEIKICMECAEVEEVLYKQNTFGRDSETKMKDVRQATQFAENKEGLNESTARRKYPAHDSFGFSFDETGSIENFEVFLFAETDQDLLDQTTPRRMDSLGRRMSRFLGAFGSFGADPEDVVVADVGKKNVDGHHGREDTHQDFCNKDMNDDCRSKPRQGWRANRRGSMMNMVISFKPKSTSKTSKGDDSSERNPIPVEQRRCQEKEEVQNEPQPSQKPQRRFNRRGSVVDMIQSMSFKASSARKTTMGDISQKHPTSLNRQSESESESRRGSKYQPRFKLADKKLVQEQPNPLHAKQATCQDDEGAGNGIQPSNDMFDKVAAGRFSRRGSFLTNGTASTASTLGLDLNHGSEPRYERIKSKPRVKDAKNNLGADVNYNEKISSILYAK